ncbi:hypothetical protein F4678DRAFT_485612 [Xylaria arbuscula]|nr:hypothetical protein F4678DRAFT_485612 [Xylaria arbuscula]
MAYEAFFSSPLSPLFSEPGNGVIPRQNADKDFYLRIMPLGASITAGYGTFPQNGYRKPLRDQLRWRGWPVNMVGSLADGDPETFHNRQHEGHKGFVVGQMKAVADNTIPRQPNLILINCGTNDADPGNKQDIPNTAARMEALLIYLYGKIDGVTIILSTLLERKDQYNSNVQNIINPGYRDLYQRFSAEGRKIVLAEFDDGFLDLSTDYYGALHPNEKGAAKLAAVWDQAIQVAEDKGFLTPPINTGKPDNGTISDTTCDVTLGAGRGPVRTQDGSGADDGPYAHDEEYSIPLRLSILKLGPDKNQTVVLEGDHTQLFFAQLVNIGDADPTAYEDELIHCSDKTADEVAGSCVMYINNGVDFTTAPGVMLDVGLKCLTSGIRWGDVNGDGLDDFICIDLYGNMFVSINQGGNPPTFKPTGDGGLIRKGESWVTQDRVRLGDMDGDGRLDYCAIDDKGDIYCWRNGGVGLAPTTAEGGYWQGLVGGGPTFFAQGEPEGIDGVRLVDINGDGRSDWVYVYDDGSTKIFTNQRGDKDDDGPGLRPHWTRATKDHDANGIIAAKHNVHFGRIWGSGKADRIITVRTPPDTDNLYSLYPFHNTGKGGTKIKGDGVYYCDMFGRGYDDYLWVLSTGQITLYENINSPPTWGQHGVIIDIDRDRKSIQFGDWDGDGLCDILAVERHTGRVEWWRNTYKPGDASPTFAKPTWAVDTGSNLCTEGWGLGVYDQALKFGDLDGDKRVDYLCMMKDGQTFGSLNKAGGLQYKDQIKYAPSGHFDRANFKWADVTGDGLVDLIWVDKFTGKARVWKNGGFIPVAGSSMTWLDEGTRFDGYGRGENIHFPILGSQKRADYHDVYPGTCVANTWFNECPDVGQGEDDYPIPIDPHLPIPPGLDPGDSGSTPTTIFPDSVGEVFTTNFQDGSLRNVQVGLLESPLDFPDIDCDITFVGGNDGNTLSCIAESTAWLYYSIQQLGGPTEPSLQRRDLSSTTHQFFTYHDQWNPRGNCSTPFCMMLSTAPLNTWIEAGNGTSGGVFHDLHFANFGSTSVHRVYRGGFDNSTWTRSSWSSKRQYTYRTAHWRADFHQGNKLLIPEGSAAWNDWYGLSAPDTELQVSDSIGSAVEDVVAITNFHNLCLGFGVAEEAPEYGYMEFGYPGLAEPTSDKIGDNLKNCGDYLGTPKPQTIVCYTNFTMDNEGTDPDEIDDGTGPLPWQNLMAKVRRWLFFWERSANSGSQVPYNIRNVVNGGPGVTIYSARYPTGHNGQDLDAEKGDESAYALSNPADCTSSALRDDAETDLTQPGSVAVDAEHMFPERQGIRNFFEYVQAPTMDEEDGNGPTTDALPSMSFDIIASFGQTLYRDWGTQFNLPPGFDTDLLNIPGSLFNDSMDAIGSSANPEVMTNLQGSVNRYKGVVVQASANPTSDASWDAWADNPSLHNTREALQRLRLGFATFSYMNDAHILDLTHNTYDGLQAAVTQFDQLYGMASPNGPTNLRAHLNLGRLAKRVTNHHRQYVTRRLDSLEASWDALVASAGVTQQQRMDAQMEYNLINQMRQNLNAIISFDADDFCTRP